MNILYQRSQGIPRLINIIADRSLVAAFAKERTDVTAAMVHQAANEVQLGESQVKRIRWPWLAATAAVLAAVALAVYTLDEPRVPADFAGAPIENTDTQSQTDLQLSQPAIEPMPEEIPVEVPPVPEEEITGFLEPDWLADHQHLVWQGLADVWHHPGAAFSVEAACNGDNSRGYACLRDQGSWSKIRQLGLPVVLILQEQTPTYLLLQGMDNNRLLAGSTDDLVTVSKDSVESRWFGAYLVAWPQASGWPATVKLGDTGAAVTTIMEMAARVNAPYDGDHLFDVNFERWLRSFQLRNGLEADGIVGRNTLLHLMTASIDEPQLLQTW